MLAVNPLSSKQRVPFDEQTTQAYTHGLEQIYALETIDPTKIKKIELSKPVEVEAQPAESQQVQDLWNGQHELELGDEYRGWVPPLFLKEPVQMLELSQRAEIVCQDRGVERLIDLIGVDFNDWIGEKGVGQGHIDEIQQKLLAYINGRSLERSYYIEWGALLRSLTVGMESKKAYVVFKTYGLESYLPLTPIERMESLNLQEQTKKVWSEEALREFRESRRSTLVKEALSQICRVFIAPWIRARGGVANLNEVIERTERVSEEQEIVAKAMKFIEEMYAFQGHPLAGFLVEVEKGLYCPDRYTSKAFEAICEKALSYFYNQNNVYTFRELISLLAKEFGASWEGYPEILAEMSLKKSGRFRVRKGESGALTIYRNASSLRTHASQAPHAAP